MTVGRCPVRVTRGGLAPMIPGITAVGTTALVGISHGGGMIRGGAIHIGAGGVLPIGLGADRHSILATRDGPCGHTGTTAMTVFLLATMAVGAISFHAISATGMSVAPVALAVGVTTAMFSAVVTMAARA